jgi:hypothetical protein
MQNSTAHKIQPLILQTPTSLPAPPSSKQQTFVGVIGGVYDVAFKPLQGVATAINPILDGAKSVIDTLTCVRACACVLQCG